MHDSVPLAQLLDAVVPVKGKRGRPRQRPGKLHADKAYDYQRCRQARELGISDARVERIVDTYGSQALATALPELKKRVERSFPESVRDPERYLLSLMPGHAERASVKAAEVAAKRQPDSVESRGVQGRRKMAYEAAWKERRFELIEEDFRRLSSKEQSRIVSEILAAMEGQGAHPQIIKRLRKEGWTHKLVKGKFLAMYAEATVGTGWNVATHENLLDVAVKLGDAGVN